MIEGTVPKNVLEAMKKIEAQEFLVDSIMSPDNNQGEMTKVSWKADIK
jgi:hypothetical protein